MKARFSQSFKDLLQYLFSGGITRLLPFFLLPYAARILSNQDFGLYALYRLYITLGATLLLLGLEQALFRLVPEEKGAMAYKTLGTALYFILSLFVVVFLLTFSADTFLNAIFFEADNPFPFYWLPLFILLNALSTLLITFFSARKQTRNYLITNVVGQTSFFLIFLFGLYWGQGLKAFFYAVIFSNLLIFLINGTYWRLALKAGFEYGILQKLMRIGFPLMLVTLITYLLYQSDHYIIKYFLGLRLTGIYNYGYRFGAVILMFVTMANNVWLPRVYGLGEPFLIKHLRAYSALITISCAGIYWLIVLLFHAFKSTLVPSGFEASLLVLYIVGISYIIYGHVHTIDGWLILKNRNRALVGISAAGLLINIVLNILLVPRFGILSAALITGLSFLIIWALLLIYLRRFVGGRYLLAMAFKVLLIASPALLLFSGLPVWSGFLLFLLIAFVELRRNTLLPQLFGLQKTPGA